MSLKPHKNSKNSSDWKITYEHFRPAQEGLREALCTLGNGYFATRGAITESGASRVNYPGTYIAGVYNKLGTHVQGRLIHNEDFVNCSNWLCLKIRMDKGNWITPTTAKIISYHQELDMKKGLLSRRVLFQDDKGKKVIICEERIVHMQEPHKAAIRYVIIPQNYEGEITIASSLDGTVKNTGVARYRQLNSVHLEPHCLGVFDKTGIYLSMSTNHSNIEISQAAKVQIFHKDNKVKFSSKILKEGRKKICQEFKIFVRKKEQYSVEKVISIYTSKDKGIKNVLLAAIKSTKRAPRFKELLKTHKKAWNKIWNDFSIKIKGDSFSQKVLRLHAFHLFQTASIHNIDIDAGLSARGLHGEAYRGHIFWDELYAMAFYDLHNPQISKALIKYRHKRLKQARVYAQENGYNGAMFPWQSGSTGQEETQVIHLNPISGKWGMDYSRIQRHVSFAIAYNVWLHYKRTADVDFLKSYGAELLLSIAQFGASLSKYDRKSKRYHTQGVMGPDEFHERFPQAQEAGFKDNAYTNILIVWTLLRAKEALSILPKQQKEKICKKLKLNEKELQQWDDITRRMNLVINKEGIISQFKGYFQLKELKWALYRKKYGNIKRLDRILKAEGKSPNDYKCAKQADVLMIFYLFGLPEVKELFKRLGYKFSKSMLEKNYKYYIKRTSHGSTLSKVVHCYVAYLLGKHKESWRWFQEVLKSDIYDTQGGTTPEGIHAGVMGGSIDMVMRGFAGLELLKDRIKIQPRIPSAWQSFKLNFNYRKNKIFLFISNQKMIISMSGTKKSKVFVEVEGKMHKLASGKKYEITLKGEK